MVPYVTRAVHYMYMYTRTCTIYPETSLYIPSYLNMQYTKVVKQKKSDKQVNSPSPAGSDDEQPPVPLWTGSERMLPHDDVPSTLHQSREILRLAQVMKQEVEEMRREVQRELEMARRERQEAELLKKNAAEILRMAKEKLHQKLPS